jgi:hypothetical protein
MGSGLTPGARSIIPSGRIFLSGACPRRVISGIAALYAASNSEFTQIAVSRTGLHRGLQ